MSTSFVRAPDGVRIAFDEAGAPDAPPIVLVHGFAQSRDVWRPVLDGPLAGELRLIAMDLRGHGDSDKPDGDDAYTSGDRLGGDLHAIIDGLGLSRPVLVAWSYGGVVVGEYLRRHGGADLGGVLLVAAAAQVGKHARAFFGPAMLSNARALLADDRATYEAGARAFLGACAAAPIDPELLERGISAMLRVPAHVRRAFLSRSEDFSPELSRCEAPLATLHGDRDPVVLPLMSEHVQRTVPSSESVVLGGVGHLPWLEAPDAFVALVRAIVARGRNSRSQSPNP